MILGEYHPLTVLQHHPSIGCPGPGPSPGTYFFNIHQGKTIMMVTSQSCQTIK